MRREFLRIDNGCKTSENSVQLYSVCMQAYQSETYGVLCGDMKSVDYLLDILCGRNFFDYGRMYYKGQVIESGKEKSYQKKIVVLGKHSHLIDNLSIAENIYIVGEKSKHFFIQKRTLEDKLKEQLACFHIGIPMDRSVTNLKNLERYQLELLKAYIKGMECVILDWREDFLTNTECEEIACLVERLKRKDMTFLWIDYNAERIVKYSNAIMILSRGKTVRMLEYRPFQIQKIYELLWGSRQFDEHRQFEDINMTDQNVVVLQGVRTMNLYDLSLTVERGEIATIVGDDRKSIEELAELFKGDIQKYEGIFLVAGKKYHPKGCVEAVKQGVCFVENRSLDDGLFLNMSVYENICIAKGSKVKSLWWRPRYQKSIIQFIKTIFGKDISQKSIKDLTILERKKLVYYRWILYHPNVLICTNPFSAVDMYISRGIELMLQECAKRGMGVLVLTDNYWPSIGTKSSFYMLEKGNLKKIV